MIGVRSRGTVEGVGAAQSGEENNQDTLFVSLVPILTDRPPPHPPDPGNIMSDTYIKGSNAPVHLRYVSFLDVGYVRLTDVHTSSFYKHTRTHTHTDNVVEVQ